jgi:hypothetical protein
MNRLALTVAASIVLATSALVPASGSTSAADLTPAGAAATATAGDAARFRQEFGFRSDAAYVQQSLADAAAFPNTRFGVPLTTAEGAEMQRRIDVQQAVTPAAEWAADEPDFGGWYIDQLNGGMPVLLVARDPAAFGRSFGQHLAASAAYQVAAVANSQVALQALEDRIWADRADLKAAGIDVQGVALDIRANAVHVEVTGLTGSAAAELRARYGAVEPVENAPAGADTCVDRSNCLPAKGGIKITDVQHPASWCTLGFNAKLYSNGARLMLTAGHCLLEGTAVSDSWKHGSTTLGSGVDALWGPTYDTGLITRGATAGDQNLVFWSSASDIPHVVAIASLSGMPVGTPACRSGATSGYFCGQVTLIEATKDVDNTTVQHMWVEDFDASPGDSGAPVGLETAPDRLLAYGTHSDSTSLNPTNPRSPGEAGWFMPIVYSAQAMLDRGHHFIVCTLPTC